MTVEEMLQIFFAELGGELAPATIATYRYALDNMCCYLGGTKEVTAVSRADLVLWRSKLQGERSAASANTYFRIGCRFWAWMVDWLEEDGVDFRSPARRIKPLRVEDTEPKAIDGEDVLRLVAEAYRDGNLRNQAIVLFLFSTGGRVGGLCRLTLDNFEPENGRAWVVEKGDKGRYLYLPEVTVSAVSRYVQYQRPNVRDPHLFLSNRRKPLTRQGVWYALKTLAAAAGIDGPCNPHSFRHAFAIAYLKNGGDLSSLSRILGHTTISVTHRSYCRWSEGELQALHTRNNPLANLALPEPDVK